MRIVCDIDGVLFPWEDNARKLLAAHRGVEVSPSEHWNWIERHVSKEDWRWLWDDGISLGLFHHAAPYAGASKGVERLMRLGHVAFVTKRPARAAIDTLAWLARWDFPAQEVHVLEGRDKSTIQPHADVYIDDSPWVAADIMANTDADIVMLDRPWNRDVPIGSRLYRAERWENVVTIIRDMKELKAVA